MKTLFLSPVGIIWHLKTILVILFGGKQPNYDFKFHPVQGSTNWFNSARQFKELYLPEKKLNTTHAYGLQVARLGKQTGKTWLGFSSTLASTSVALVYCIFENSPLNLAP